MESCINTQIRTCIFCGIYENCMKLHWHLSSHYDMIIVLGRCEDRPDFLLDKQRNNPWRISSSRWNAKGYFCSFLVSNICWLTSLSAGSTQAFGMTNLSFLQEDLNGESPLSWRFYLYIGITSLYFYDTAWHPILQDGILHKKVLCKSFKR